MYKNINNKNPKQTVPSEFNGGLTYPQTVHELVERVNEMDSGTTDIKDGSVTSVKLADGAVVGSKLGAGSVNTTKLADNAVTTSKLTTGAVTSDKIASVSTSKLTTDIPTGQVLMSNGSTIVSETITGVPTGGTAGQFLGTDGSTASWKDISVTPVIPDGSITNDKLAPNSVDASKIIDGSVGSLELARASVTSDKLASNAVTNASIADKSIDPDKLTSIPAGTIPDGSITATQLAVNAVVEGKIANGAVTNSKIAIGGVGTTNIVENAVTTNEISGSGGTNGQVLTTNGVKTSWTTVQGGGGGLPPDDSITTNMLQDGSVTNNKISSMTGAKLTDGTVMPAKLSTIGSTANQVLTSDGTKVLWATASSTPGANTITNSMLTTDCVDAPNVKDASLTGAKFAPTSISNDKLSSTSASTGQVLMAGDNDTVVWADGGGGSLPPDDSVTSAMLKANSVTKAKIASGSVDDSKLASSAVTQLKIASSAITATKIAEPTYMGSSSKICMVDDIEITPTWVQNTTTDLYEFVWKSPRSVFENYIGATLRLGWCYSTSATSGFREPIPVLMGKDSVLYSTCEGNYVSSSNYTITFRTTDASISEIHLFAIGQSS